jgi:predicted small metal-binding protein
MFDHDALRCECGYEVKAADEAACTDAVRRHAREHGIDLPVELARDLVLRAAPAPNGEHDHNEARKEKR